MIGCEVDACFLRVPKVSDFWDLWNLHKLVVFVDSFFEVELTRIHL